MNDPKTPREWRLGNHEAASYFDDYFVRMWCDPSTQASLDNIIVRVKQQLPKEMRWTESFYSTVLHARAEYYEKSSQDKFNPQAPPRQTKDKISAVMDLAQNEIYGFDEIVRGLVLVLQPAHYLCRRNKQLVAECRVEEELPYQSLIVIGCHQSPLDPDQIRMLNEMFVGVGIGFDAEVHSYAKPGDKSY